MSCSINKLKSQMLFTCKRLCFLILRGKKNLLPFLYDLGHGSIFESKVSEMSRSHVTMSHSG